MEGTRLSNWSRWSALSNCQLNAPQISNHFWMPSSQINREELSAIKENLNSKNMMDIKCRLLDNAWILILQTTTCSLHCQVCGTCHNFRQLFYIVTVFIKKPNNMILIGQYGMRSCMRKTQIFGVDCLYKNIVMCCLEDGILI